MQEKRIPRKGEERLLLIVVLAPGTAVSAQSIEAHIEGKVAKRLVLA
jgi:hypothetical protein